jgi:putative heme-binding domain-containing protein
MRSGSLYRARVVGSSIIAIVLASIAWLIAPSASNGRAHAAEAAPATDAQRVPWTTGRVSGSPDPAPPYQLEKVFPKLEFNQPVDIAFEPGSNRIFVVELAGKIYSFPNDPSCAKPDLAIDLVKEVRGLKQVPNCKGIQQAFGFTFHPQYEKNHYCYVCYILDPADGNPLANGTRVSRFTVTHIEAQPGKPPVPHLDPASELILLDWREGGHNGGCLKFGPDGYLYISAGDGADPNPPDGKYHTGQDISDLMSSVLRIDVDHAEAGRPYAVPADNPFVKTPGARPEVWAYGLRNPWKMSFDRATGNLWIGDVGWELWEMVDRGVPGGNYGWSITEGPQPVYPDLKPGPTPVLKPDLVLPHTESASVTGGYVYRGKRLPELVGHYVFGDWETRRIWAAKAEGPNASKLAPYRTIALTDLRVITFGEDPAGELYVMDFEGGGGIYRLVPNPDVGRPSNFPRKLSETGLFTSVASHQAAPGVVPFAINAEQWNDGATAERLVAVPGTQPVMLKEDRKVFPKDSVLVRTFSLELQPGKPESRRRVETQLLHFDGRRWNGYTYQWNDQQTDADLVDGAGAERTWTIADSGAPGGKREKTWHYPSRAQCATCHTSWNDYTPAYDLPQLDHSVGHNGSRENQVALLRSQGLLPPAPGPRQENGRTVPPPPAPKPLADPRDESADLNSRARAYLHANCSHCHRMGGGGSALIDLRYDLDADKTHAIDAPPMLGNFDIAGARIVAPGDPGRSVLLCRMAKLGRGRMPHIGSYELDPAGVVLIERWIEGMRNGSSAASDSTAAKGRAEDEAALKAVCAAKTPEPQVAPAIDRLLGSTSGALLLQCALDRGQVAGPVREVVIAKGTASTQETVRDLFEPFLPPDKLVKRLGTNINPAQLLSMKGDAGRGRLVFFGNDPAAGAPAVGSAATAGSALCRQCHKLDGQGEDFGPDLSHVAMKYDRAALLDNILNPSKTIDPKYITYLVKTTKGDDYIGLLVEKTVAEVVIKDAQRQVIRVPAGDVAKMTPQAISSMPEGLLGSLTAQQAADLLEYLATRK